MSIEHIYCDYVSASHLCEQICAALHCAPSSKVREHNLLFHNSFFVVCCIFLTLRLKFYNCTYRAIPTAQQPQLLPTDRSYVFIRVRVLLLLGLLNGGLGILPFRVIGNNLSTPY